MINEMKTLRDLIIKMLEDFPETRDNDRLLLLKIWKYQNPRIKDPDFTFTKFAIDFLNKDFANPESIRRPRADIQKKFPHLRGENYKGNQAEGETGRQYFNPGADRDSGEDPEDQDPGDQDPNLFT